NCALLRPDIFRACALLSVPYVPRGSTRPSIGRKALEGNDKNFYQEYFQQPGKVEAELDADPRKSMAMILYSASGDAPPDGRFGFLFPKAKKFIETGTMPEKLPKWLTEADLDFFAGEFKRAGFRGGVNWYRNMDRNWDLTPFLNGAKLQQPSMFVAGENDVVMEMLPEAMKIVELSMPNCRQKAIIPGAGHWIQQERPHPINEALIEFAKSL